MAPIKPKRFVKGMCSNVDSRCMLIMIDGFIVAVYKGERAEVARLGAATARMIAMMCLLPSSCAAIVINLNSCPLMRAGARVRFGNLANEYITSPVHITYKNDGKTRRSVHLSYRSFHHL